MDCKQDFEMKIPSHTKTLSRMRIIKNLLVISFTFVLLFSAYDGLSMLQSTMNGKNGVGSASQATIYMTFAISSLLLPKFTIKKLGCKTTLFVGTVLYLPYIAANVYPTWYTMIPSAVLIGIGAGILWASQCSYFNKSAGIYCNLEEGNDVKKQQPYSKAGDKHSGLYVKQNGAQRKMPLKSEWLAEPTFFSQSETKAKVCDISKKCSGENIVLECKDTGSVVEHQDIDVNDDEQINLQKIAECQTTNNHNSEKQINGIINGENVQGMESNMKDAVLSYSCDKAEKIPIERVRLSETHKFPSSLVEQVKEIGIRTSSISQSLKNYIIPEDNPKLHRLESITARFFGAFGAIYYTAQIWSNLISYYILNNSDNNVTRANYSCGAGYCNSELSSDDADEIAISTRYLLIGITTSLSILSSLLVLFFLDPLDGEGVKEDVAFSLGNVLATFNQLKKKEQLFIIPLSIFSGLNQGFYTADFTKSYIQCAWNISYVGLVTVFFGIACGVSSTMSGFVVKYVGRLPVILFGLVLHLGIDVFLLEWNPDEHQRYLFYVTAALWGAKVGIIWSQIQAFYGLLFKNDEEAAFATHYFCSAIGWMISFAYSDRLCTSTKIYILMAASCCGMLGYLLADRSYRRRSKY